MKDDSIQVGWDWTKVDDTTFWKIPEGDVKNLPFYIGKPPGKVLDLGCGLGRHTVFLAAMGYDVSAIDISEEAVRKTKEWLDQENLQAVVFPSKMTTLDFPDNSFDLVLAYNVIYHAFKHDILKTISEIYRVLKPNGHFYCTILTKDPNQPFYNKGSLVDKQTIVKQEEPEKGIPHFFSYIEDVLDFFKDFNIKNLYYNEWYPPPITLERVKDRKGNGHYHILAQKL